MKIIKTIPNVPLYDKNYKDFNCINTVDEIMLMLYGAPVTDANNKNILVGSVYKVSHKKGGLYLGDIVLKDEYNDWNKLKLVDTRGIPTQKGSHKMKSILIYVEKVED